MADITPFSVLDNGEISYEEVGGMSMSQLVKQLDEVFPEESPQLGESLTDLYWRGGERSVVKYIHKLIELEETM